MTEANRVPVQRRADLLEAASRRFYLTSGTEGLDGILGGKGFESGRVYEIYGLSGTGRSNLLHQLVCLALAPATRGGLGSGVIYLDVEGSFSPRHLRRLANRFQVNPTLIDRKILCAHPPTSAILLMLCETPLEKQVKATGARLICLDGIATHFLAEYGYKRETYRVRQVKAMRVLSTLIQVTRQFNAIVIFTNMIADQECIDLEQEEEAREVIEDYKELYREPRPTHPPYCQRFHPNSVGGLADVSIYAQSRSSTVKRFILQRAVDLPLADCSLTLTESGFYDFEEVPKTE